MDNSVQLRERANFSQRAHVSCFGTKPAKWCEKLILQWGRREGNGNFRLLTKLLLQPEPTSRLWPPSVYFVQYRCPMSPQSSRCGVACGSAQGEFSGQSHQALLAGEDTARHIRTPPLFYRDVTALQNQDCRHTGVFCGPLSKREDGDRGRQAAGMIIENCGSPATALTRNTEC